MPQIQLTITLDSDTGSTSVSGPLDNQIMAYGMLEVARDAIWERKQKDAQSVIQMPSQGILLPGV
jgi:hypothetical protein